jgi:hypothetical protein
MEAEAFILSFLITWSIGLLPPILIRYALVRRPLARWASIGVCALFLIVNIALFEALGSESKSHGALALVAFDLLP